MRDLRTVACRIKCPVTERLLVIKRYQSSSWTLPHIEKFIVGKAEVESILRVIAEILPLFSTKIINIKFLSTEKVVVRMLGSDRPGVLYVDLFDLEYDDVISVTNGMSESAKWVEKLSFLKMPEQNPVNKALIKYMVGTEKWWEQENGQKNKM